MISIISIVLLLTNVLQACSCFCEHKPLPLTPLMQAAEKNDTQRIVALLGQGASIDEQQKAADPTGAEPVTALCIAARSGAVDAVRVLIQQGADVNLQTCWDGETVLMMLVGKEDASKEIIELLISAGADVNHVARYGMTPLEEALVYSKNCWVVERLLRAGAFVNARNRNGKTPLEVAVAAGCSNDVLQLLAAYDGRATSEYLHKCVGSALFQ